MASASASARKDLRAPLLPLLLLMGCLLGAMAVTAHAAAAGANADTSRKLMQAAGRLVAKVAMSRVPECGLGTLPQSALLLAVAPCNLLAARQTSSWHRCRYAAALCCPAQLLPSPAQRLSPGPS